MLNNHTWINARVFLYYLLGMKMEKYLTRIWHFFHIIIIQRRRKIVLKHLICSLSSHVSFCDLNSMNWILDLGSKTVIIPTIIIPILVKFVYHIFYHISYKLLNSSMSVAWMLNILGKNKFDVRYFIADSIFIIS